MEKVYIFFLILLTGTVYGVLANSILLTVSELVLAGLFFKDIQARYNLNLLGTYLVMSGLFGFILLLHFLLVPFGNDPLPYMGFLFRFISVGLFCVYVKSREISLIDALQQVLKVIAIHAVISFALSFFAGKFLVTIQTDTFRSYTFGYLFFYNSVFEVLGLKLYRNQGIFWEPGVLQIYMNILFFVSSFVIRNKRLQILAAFLIITTYSTTGIGLLLIQLLVILFSANASAIQKVLITIALSVVMLPVFVLNYAQKINDEGGGSDITSSALRLYDLVEGVQIIKEYPLTGVGLSQQAYKAFKKTHSFLTSNYSQEFSDMVAERRSSNSVLYFFTRFGVPIALFWAFLLYRQTFFFEKRWLFFMLVIIENFSEPLLIEPFFLLIAASGFFSLILFRFKGLPPQQISDVNE